MLKEKRGTAHLDYLAKQLGVNLQELSKDSGLPKWRRLEVLNELKVLSSQVQNIDNSGFQ